MRPHEAQVCGFPDGFVFIHGCLRRRHRRRCHVCGASGQPDAACAYETLQASHTKLFHCMHTAPKPNGDPWPQSGQLRKNNTRTNAHKPHIHTRCATISMADFAVQTPSACWRTRQEHTHMRFSGSFRSAASFSSGVCLRLCHV